VSAGMRTLRRSERDPIAVAGSVLLDMPGRYCPGMARTGRPRSEGSDHERGATMTDAFMWISLLVLAAVLVMTIRSQRR
jgi:hypothetical protein